MDVPTWIRFLAVFGSCAKLAQAIKADPFYQVKVFSSDLLGLADNTDAFDLILKTRWEMNSEV